MDIFSQDLLSTVPIQNEAQHPEAESFSFASDIQDMMYGFGDSAEPLLESAQLIEEIIHQQMISAYYRAMEVAELRGSSKVVRVEDVMFLLRNNKPKLQRILKFFALKEMKRNMSASLDDEVVPEGTDVKSALGRNNSLISYLLSIDQTGELEDIVYSAGFEMAWTGRAGDRDKSTPRDGISSPLFSPLVQVDMVKLDRSLRADEMTRAMDKSSYLRFFEARRACFTQPKTGGMSRFWEWIISPRGKIKNLKSKKKGEKDTTGISDSKSDEEQLVKPTWPQPTSMALEVLSYMAFEAVAQIVDLALLVRRDGIRSMEDRLMPPLYFNPSFPLYQENMVKSGVRFRPYPRKTPIGVVPRSSADSMVRCPQPLTPAEIQEAMRRYWSPSTIGPLSHFSRERAPLPTRRLLCC